MKYLKLYESFKENKDITKQIDDMNVEVNNINKKMKFMIKSELKNFLNYYKIDSLDVDFFRIPIHVGTADVKEINVCKDGIELLLRFL